jgi:hypothetical protein
VVIRLPLEHPPRVYLDCLNDGEESRLRDWLDAHPDYARLVEEALELAARERAA